MKDDKKQDVVLVYVGKRDSHDHGYIVYNPDGTRYHDNGRIATFRKKLQPTHTLFLAFPAVVLEDNSYVTSKGAVPIFDFEHNISAEDIAMFTKDHQDQIARDKARSDAGKHRKTARKGLSADLKAMYKRSNQYLKAEMIKAIVEELEK